MLRASRRDAMAQKPATPVLLCVGVAALAAVVASLLNAGPPRGTPAVAHRPPAARWYCLATHRTFTGQSF